MAQRIQIIGSSILKGGEFRYKGIHNKFGGNGFLNPGFYGRVLSPKERRTERREFRNVSSFLQPILRDQKSRNEILWTPCMHLMHHYLPLCTITMTKQIIQASCSEASCSLCWVAWITVHSWLWWNFISMTSKTINLHHVHEECWIEQTMEDRPSKLTRRRSHTEPVVVEGERRARAGRSRRRFLTLVKTKKMIHIV